MAAPGDHPVCLSLRSRRAVRPVVSLHAAAIRHRRGGREGSRHSSYLSRREAAHAGVKPGLAKAVIWNDPTARHKTPLSLVYIHGFSASRKDIAPVIESLAGTLGANAFLTRLAAHGRATSAEFATVTPQDWLNDAREALAIGRRVGDRVILIGTSTGALLATIVALMDFLNHARSVHLGTLKMPILVIYTDQDMVVDTAAIQARFDEIQGQAKLIVDLPEASRHELTGDALAPDTVRPVVQRILKFLAETDVADTTIA